MTETSDEKRERLLQLQPLTLAVCELIKKRRPDLYQDGDDATEIMDAVDRAWKRGITAEEVYDAIISELEARAAKPKSLATRAQVLCRIQTGKDGPYATLGIQFSDEMSERFQLAREAFVLFDDETRCLIVRAERGCPIDRGHVEVVYYDLVKWGGQLGEWESCETTFSPKYNGFLIQLPPGTEFDN